MAAWLGYVAHRLLLRVALALRAPVRSRALRGLHRFGRIFYLFNLLDLRETLAARLCFGTQNTQIWKDDNNL